LNLFYGAVFVNVILEPWRIPEAEFKPESIYYEMSKPYRLWFEYLRLSPTYWLAHKNHWLYKGDLTKEERRTLPPDFDEVIKTYNRFGNVYGDIFRTWWNNQGAYAFGAPTSLNNVELVSKAWYGDHKSNIDKCFSDIQDYYTKGAADFYFNSHDILLVSIPKKGKKSDLKKQLEQLIDENCYDILEMSKDSQQNEDNRIYKLHGERFRLKASITGLRLLWTKAQYRNLESWQIGALADISKIHKFTNIKKPPKNDKERQDRITLGALTNRKIKSALVVMENAARGKFSCNDDVVVPEINYQYMWQNIRRRTQANKDNNLKQLKKYLSINPKLRELYGNQDILKNE